MSFVRCQQQNFLMCLIHNFNNATQVLSVSTIMLAFCAWLDISLDLKHIGKENVYNFHKR